MSTMLSFAKTVRNLKSWEIGMRRIRKILAEEKSNGFRAVHTGMYSDGLDIFVFKGTELVRVYEVTNWAKKSELQEDRGKRYRDNLLQYSDVDMVFVCSYNENLEKLGGSSFFTQHGIRVVVKGYQD